MRPSSMPIRAGSTWEFWCLSCPKFLFAFLADRQIITLTCYEDHRTEGMPINISIECDSLQNQVKALAPPAIGPEKADR